MGDNLDSSIVISRQYKSLTVKTVALEILLFQDFQYRIGQEIKAKIS